jgi:two-component system sensor histidine kinase RegB
MSIEGAEPAGEAFEEVSVGALMASVQSSFSPTFPLQVHVAEENHAAVLTIPRHAVEQAIIALVKNAMEASPAGAPVSLSASQSDASSPRPSIRFNVKDCGSGMSLDSLRHAGEPFFTTKEPGQGMGLGIFLVRTLADRLGGRLSLESSPGVGTSAVLELPWVHAVERVRA